MIKIFIKGTVLAVSGMLVLGGCSADHEEPTAQEALAEQEFAEQGTFEQVASEQKSFEQVFLGQEFSEQVMVDKESSEHLDSDAATDKMAGEGVPTIMIVQDRKEWRTDDGEVLLLDAEASKVDVISEGFDALKTSLAAQWNGIGSNYDEELELARAHYETLQAEDYDFLCYSCTANVGISRLDDQVVSFWERDYFYTGGEQGAYEYRGRTYDVESGEELQLEDILYTSEGFYDKAVKYIIEDLKKNYGETDLFPDYEEKVRTDTFGDTPVSWHLDNTGIVIDYPLYTIAPYVTGTLSVTLPYDVFSEYIKKEYLKPCDSLVARVSVNEDFSGLIDEPGEIMITAVYPDEYSDAEVTVVSGNESETVGTFWRVVDAYVIRRANGGSFLVFYCDYASDDFVTYVYEVTGGTVRACDKLDGAALSGTCVGTDRIGISMHLDVLGTYAGDMIYQLTDDGKLVQTEEIFAVNTSQNLAVIKELPVTIDGTATTIPVGSQIKITGTDNAGKAYFQMVPDDGKAGMIQYVRDDEMWQILIDGVSENEYFEMVPYAG